VTVEGKVIQLGLRHRGRVIPLDEGSHLVGRGSSCSVRIPSVTVSRRHVTLEVRGETVRVTDLGSHNGTWLNNQRLKPHESREMALYDHLYLPVEDLCLVRADESAERDSGSVRRTKRSAAGSQPTGPIAAAQLKPGGARRRFLAAMIDMAIFVVMSCLLAIPLVVEFPALPRTAPLLDRLATLAGHHDWIHLLLITAGIWVVLWMLYFVVGWGVLGATPGQAAMGLRLVDHRQRYPIGPVRALLRLVAYSVGSLPFMAGHFLVIGRSDKRALHDMLAGTRVVRKPGGAHRESEPAGPEDLTDEISSVEPTVTHDGLPDSEMAEAPPGPRSGGDEGGQP